ncbi:MAG: hypothetical protein ACI4XJ_06565 [Eubacteriales bacterium]
MSNTIRTKRLLSLIFAALILLSSCAQKDGGDTDDGVTNTPEISGENSSEETAETEEDLPAPAVENLDGAELRLLNYTQESFNWANAQIFASDITGETLNDALYNREKKVEDSYDCVIEEVADGNLINTFKNSVTAQDDTFDVGMVFDAEAANMLTGGFVMSWNNLTDLDLSNPWWDNAATEQYNFNGIQAAVSGAFSLYNYSTRHCYVVNSDMLENLSPGYDIYDTVREGKWTVDELYRLGGLAVSDLDGNGEMTDDDDQWGITGVIVRHYSAMFAGADCKYIDRNEEGKVYFAVPGNEKIVDVMTKFVNLDSGNYIYTSGYGTELGGGDPIIFFEGRALFTAAYVGEAAKMRDIEFSLGIVPPPKFTEAQDSYHSLVEGGAQTMLPKTLSSEKYHAVAVILDAFSYNSYIESIPAYIDVVLMTKVARDEDSSEMLQLVFDTSYYDLGTGIWSSIKCAYASSVFLPKADKIASTTKTNEKLMNKQLENFDKKLSELTETSTGESAE